MEDIAGALVLLGLFLGPGIIWAWSERRNKATTDPQVVRMIAETIADVSKLTGRVEALERKITEMERKHIRT